MSKVFNMVGGGGVTASIFVTGLSETDTVTATNGSKTLTGKWITKLNPAAHDLPNGYTQLEYIEATGSQYVVTNIHPSLTTVVKFGAKFTSKAPNIYIGHMANYDASGWDKSDWRFIQHASSVRLDMGATQVDSSELNAVVVNNYHDYEMGNFYLKVDGASKISSNSVTSSNGFENYPICIFGTGVGAGSPANSSGELHYVTFYEGETLTANLIPAKRNSDSVIGLYDIVNDVFYTNSGTGAFIAGPEIPQTFGGFLIKPIRDLGTWTVTAMNGEKTATQDVLVDVITEYEIEMDYKLWLYRDGDECTYVTGGWSPVTLNYASVTKGNSALILSIDGGGASRANVKTINHISIDGYTTIKFKYTAKSSGTYGKMTGYGFGIEPNDTSPEYSFSDDAVYIYHGEGILYDVDSVESIDISAATIEDGIIWAKAHSGGGLGANPFYITVTIYEIWLE